MLGKIILRLFFFYSILINDFIIFSEISSSGLGNLRVLMFEISNTFEYSHSYIVLFLLRYFRDAWLSTLLSGKNIEVTRNELESV